MNEPRLAVGVPRESESVGETLPEGPPVAEATTLYVMLLTVTLPAASRAVTVTVCGPTSPLAVGSAAPLAIATPRSVAVQETTVWSSAQENDSVAAVPWVIDAPSAGEVIAIV